MQRMSHTIALVGEGPMCTSCGEVRSFSAQCATNANKLNLEERKLDLEERKLDFEKRKIWTFLFVSVMICMMASVLLKSGTDWLGSAGDKLIASVDKTSDEVQQASHVLSASIGGIMIASGKYSPFQLVFRSLWSFIQSLGKDAQ